MYELSSERWSPVQSVEKVILSVISMLAGSSLTSRSFDAIPHSLRFPEPNLESGANIDCCKLYRENKAVCQLTRDDSHRHRSDQSSHCSICPSAGIRTSRARVNTATACARHINLEVDPRANLAHVVGHPCVLLHLFLSE